MKRQILKFSALKTIKACSILVMLFLFNTTASSQVEYAVRWTHTYDLQDTITVYMRPQSTLSLFNSQVSTAQVTLRVPEGMLPNYTSTQSGVGVDSIVTYNNGTWASNARWTQDTDQDINSQFIPANETTGYEYDYISFGLTASDIFSNAIEFNNGVEIPLFSIPFDGNICSADLTSINLVDHTIDSTFLNNGITSPFNAMTVFGFGFTNSYIGNYDYDKARCYDYDNDDILNEDDYCDYTLDADIPDINADGCTDRDNDGFFEDDNPTPEDQDAVTSSDPESSITETYNQFDPDETNTCIPQGDSLLSTMKLFDNERVEFTNGTTDLCLGDSIFIIVDMVETESPANANNPASPFDYDHRGAYQEIVINSSLGGDFSTFGYTSGDTIGRIPTSADDGTTYSLAIVKDTFECNAIELNNTGEINVQEGAELAIIDGDQNICAGQDAEIAISISGGNAGYQIVYAINGVDQAAITIGGTDTVLVVSGLAADSEFTLTSVTDDNGNGCQTDPANLIGAANVTFNNQGAITASSLTQPTTCGASDGTITVSYTGTGSVELSKDGGINWEAADPTPHVFTGLGTGIYNVAIRVDGNNDCLVLDTNNPHALASSEAPIFGNLIERDPNDCDNDDGEIEVFIQNPPSGLVVEYRLESAGTAGTAIAGEDWGSADSLFTGLAPDNYIILVRYNTSFGAGDPSASCLVSYPGGAEIDMIDAPTIVSAPFTSVTDCGEDDGEIGIQATSGTGGTVVYQLKDDSDGSVIIDWSSQNSFPNLAGGTYRILVNNDGVAGNSCIDSTTVTITSPAVTALSSAFAVDIVDCDDDESGSLVIDATTSGNVANLEFSIDGGLTWSFDDFGTANDGDYTAENLGEGIYNIAVRNSDGSCELLKSTADTITQPEDILLITPTITDITDCGNSDATIQVNLVGSDPDSTVYFGLAGDAAILPSTNLDTDLFSSLGGGSYDVIAQYPNGACADTFNVVIDAIDPVVIDAVNPTPTAECGVANGELEVLATGLEGALEYSVDTGNTWQPNNIFTGLGDTTLKIHVRYADTTCREIWGPDVVFTLPVVTDIEIADIDSMSPALCGIDDGSIGIPISLTSGVLGDNEMSLNGGGYETLPYTYTGLKGDSYLVTVRNIATPSCVDTMTITLGKNDAPQMNAKVALQGAYNPTTGLMNDDLRQLVDFPLTNPFADTTQLKDWGATGGSESHIYNVDSLNYVIDPQYGSSIYTTSNVLEVQGANAIVDWVLLELREKTDSSLIVMRRPALLQRDGQIVEWADGESAVEFIGQCAGDVDSEYWVSIKHRNHLGIMSAAPIAFGEEVVDIDFTLPETDIYVKNEAFGSPTATVAGKRALWSGNVHLRTKSLFQGANPDPDRISTIVNEAQTGNSNILNNFILKGYYNTDINLDGVTIFQGAPNDVDIIFFNIMGNEANDANPNTQAREPSANWLLNEQLPD